MKNNKKIIIALFFSFIMLIGAFAVMTSGNSNNITLPVNNIPATANRTNPVNYYIELSGAPSGTGMYQQLITINNPSDYNINTNGSNIQFVASNGTLLYAWIQNINSTTMQVWVKNYNSSSTIIMQVFPSFENLFSANGYLGEAPELSSVYGEYFNAPEVFGNSTSPNAWDFAGTSLPSGFIISTGSQPYYGSYTVNNGITTQTTNSSQAEIIQYNTGITQPYAILYGFSSPFETPTANTSANFLIYGSEYDSNYFQGDFAGTPGSASLQYPTSGGYGSISAVSVPNPSIQSLMVRGNETSTFLYYNDSLIASYDSSYFPAGNLPILAWNFGTGVYSPTISYFVIMNYPNDIMPTYTIRYPVTISESGLPANTSWSFTFNGTLYTLTNTSYTILVNNGIYSLSVNAVNGYDDTYNSTIAVNFDDVNENIVFNFTYSINIIINNPDKAFYEITINENNNITHYNLTSSLITIHVINKNFPVTISINNLKKGYVISNPIISYNTAGNYSINEKIINTNNANNLINNYTPYIIIVLILTALMIIGLIIKRGRE